MRPRSCFGNRARHATREGRHALRAYRRSTRHPEIDDDLVMTVDDQTAGHRRSARQRCVGARPISASSSIRPEERLTVERKSMTPQTARLLPCRVGALSVQHKNRANQRNRNPDRPRHGPVPVIHGAGACAFSRPRNAHCEAWRPVIPCETIPHARSRQCARSRRLKPCKCLTCC